MGGPPLPGEDQEVTVDITGPDADASPKEREAFEKSFNDWKKDINALRQKYGKLKVKVSKITYKKKNPDESFS
ncbi:MAG TPA: hypothetical protein VFE48_02635 [Methylomirabilota bacterium]|jgi:hypothetical protein|nr:hypothetical protein [Methylomirabilota bacterium]